MIRLAILLLFSCQLATGQDADTRVATARITDDAGNAVTDWQEYPLGEVVALTARSSVKGDKPRSVTWLISPVQLTQKAKVSADGLDIYIPTGTADNDIIVTLFVALDNEGDVATARIRCGSGSRPPPPQPEPGPQPPIKPDKLQLIIVEDVLNRTVATAQILNATDAWQQFRTIGYETKFYDHKTSETNGKQFASECRNKQLPCLLIRDADKNKTLEIVSPVESIKQVNEAVSKWQK